MTASQRTWDETIVHDISERPASWVVSRYPVVQPLLAYYGVRADESRPLPDAAAANGHRATDVLHLALQHILQPISWH